MGALLFVYVVNYDIRLLWINVHNVLDTFLWKLEQIRFRLKPQIPPKVSCTEKSKG